MVPYLTLGLNCSPFVFRSGACEELLEEELEEELEELLEEELEEDE